MVGYGNRTRDLLHIHGEPKAEIMPLDQTDLTSDREIKYIYKIVLHKN